MTRNAILPAAALLALAAFASAAPATAQTARAPQALAVSAPTRAGQPVTFRWTPVVPAPAGPVTYRLKVWQLMQGQAGAQAKRTNPPLITKDVDNITQAITTVGTEACAVSCDLVWEVQALNRDGKPIGGNNGTSEASILKVGSAARTGGPR